MKNETRKMLEEIKNGELIYAQIDLWEEQDITISLVNSKMLDYDELLYSDDEESFKNYKPYYASVVVNNSIDNIKKLRNIKSGWNIAKFVMGNKEFFYEKLEEYIEMEGILELSASPVNYISGKIIFFTNKAIPYEDLVKINNIYDSSRLEIAQNDENVQNVLENVWKNDIPKKIDIYNIGHGNADYIRGNHNRILYDIGYNYRSYPNRNNTRYCRAVNALRKLKPDCVILSHWDMDHIIGCAYANQSLFNVKWIAPVFVQGEKNSINSIRIAKYLKKLNNLILVNRDEQRKIASIGDEKKDKYMIKLSLGGNRDSKISLKNQQGIYIEVVANNNRVLLTGDFPYMSMDAKLNKCNYLHVPHHCSNMDTTKLDSLVINGQSKCAVISTNRKKDKINCNKEHYDKLQKIYGEIKFTIGKNINDEFKNISIQINLKKGIVIER